MVSAVCLVLAGYLLFSKPPEHRQHKAIEMVWLMPAFFCLSAVVAFVSDLIFRKFIPELTKLWVTEGVLVIFILVLIFL